MKNINLLINKATESYSFSDCDGDNNRGVRLNPEKFAELIIRKCAALQNLRGSNADYNTGRMHMASDILEHFGVK